MSLPFPVLVAVVALAAAVLAAVFILLLYPLMQRYALARPNARSSHKVPTPQGGGIAIVAASLLVAGLALHLAWQGASPGFSALALAAVVLALGGAADDIRPLPVLPRLAIQLGAVTLAVVVLGDVRLLPDLLPASVERCLVILGGIWFINLVNFMDGLDWITVAEVVPVSGAIALFAVLGVMPADGGLLAAALLGAMLGFAPFNRPVARLFLGDVGSLPIGLILGILLYRLAGEGQFVAALLLPLYYLADATLTLVRRLTRGEKVWEAHRSHFYQRATDNGFGVTDVVGSVFLLNLILAALAAVSLWTADGVARSGLFLAGMAAVAILLVRFARPRVKPA
jgi:UDP-N-acetylmuramyl pentapeptide phosphotransferase/UDP-N-acetylglucosamine-1-phosphate transferase